jgi:hypothetical protein
MGRALIWPDATAVGPPNSQRGDRTASMLIGSGAPIRFSVSQEQ